MWKGGLDIFIILLTFRLLIFAAYRGYSVILYAIIVLGAGLSYLEWRKRVAKRRLFPIRQVLASSISAPGALNTNDDSSSVTPIASADCRIPSLTYLMIAIT